MNPIVWRVDLPVDTEGCFHVLQALVGEVFETVEAVGGKAVALGIDLSTFRKHLLATRFVAVPRGVGDEHSPIGTRATQGLGQRPLVVLGVMEGGVVNDENEVVVHEREGIELCLEAGKECSEMLFVMDGSA